MKTQISKIRRILLLVLTVIITVSSTNVILVTAATEKSEVIFNQGFGDLFTSNGSEEYTYYDFSLDDSYDQLDFSLTDIGIGFSTSRSGEDRDIVNNITVSACVMLTTANPRSNDLDKLRSNAIFTKDISFTNHVIENQTEDYAGNINSYADSIKAENLNISKGKLYLVLYNTTVTSEYYSCSFEGNANITIHKSAAKIESENSTETTGTENVHTAKNPTMKVNGKPSVPCYF